MTKHRPWKPHLKKIEDEGDAARNTHADLPQTPPVVTYTRAVSAYPEAHMYSAVRTLTPTNTLRDNEANPIVPRSGTSIKPDRRHSTIAEAAYYHSEHRGFAFRNALDGSLAAERQVDAPLRRKRRPAGR